MNKRNIIKTGFITSTIIGSILFIAGITYIIYPQSSPMEVPSNLRAQNTPLSDEFLASSKYASDYSKLNDTFESQIYRSYCGVASSVITLNALGHSASQDTFFSHEKAGDVRPFFKVFLTGMPLSDLEGLLNAYGASTRKYFASDMSVNDFRRILKKNMSNPNDYIVVNYLRSSLGQNNVGHISPLGAYQESTDEVLIMDVTTYNYPHVWVKTETLFNAMNTQDSEHTRGFIEVF